MPVRLPPRRRGVGGRLEDEKWRTNVKIVICWPSNRAVFIGGGFEFQRLAGGSDGAISGTTFTSVQADFDSTNILAGMVLCTYSTVPAEGCCYEIVSVDSATTMTVSILRESEDDQPVAPSTVTNQKYFIDTFAPQIAGVEASLNEKLRRFGEACGISPEEFADSSHMRKAVALGALAAVFTAPRLRLRR